MAQDQYEIWYYWCLTKKIKRSETENNRNSKYIEINRFLVILLTSIRVLLPFTKPSVGEEKGFSEQIFAELWTGALEVVNNIFHSEASCSSTRIIDFTLKKTVETFTVCVFLLNRKNTQRVDTYNSEQFRIRNIFPEYLYFSFSVQFEHRQTMTQTLQNK